MDLEDVLQGPALDVFHHQKKVGTLLDKGIHSCNVGMMQFRQDDRLRVEALHHVRPAGQFWPELLDGHLAFQYQVFANKDLTHATGADGASNLVCANGSADHCRHSLATLLMGRSVAHWRGA